MFANGTILHCFHRPPFALFSPGELPRTRGSERPPTEGPPTEAGAEGGGGGGSFRHGGMRSPTKAIGSLMGGLKRSIFGGNLTVRVRHLA